MLHHDSRCARAGSIPEELGSLSHMRLLLLEDNQFSGEEHLSQKLSNCMTERKHGGTRMFVGTRRDLKK